MNKKRKTLTLVALAVFSVIIALPLGRLWYLEVRQAIDFAKHQSRSYDAVIRVYDLAGKLIELHRHKGDFKE